MEKNDLLKNKKEKFVIKVNKISDTITKAERFNKENSKKYKNWIKEISDPNFHFIKDLSKYFLNDLTTINTKQNILKIVRKLYQLNKDIVGPQINNNKVFTKYLASYINSDDNSKTNNNIIKEIDINKKDNKTNNKYDNIYIYFYFTIIILQKKINFIVSTKRGLKGCFR